jgi:hypothetical protein
LDYEGTPSQGRGHHTALDAHAAVDVDRAYSAPVKPASLGLKPTQKAVAGPESDEATGEGPPPVAYRREQSPLRSAQKDSLVERRSR